MSYSLHAYLPDPDRTHDEAWAFNAIRKLFRDSNGVEFLPGKNPLTKQNILKLKIDELYFVSIFFEMGSRVQPDLKAISGIDAAMPARIRVLFGPDPRNNYDDIGVIILDFLEKLEKSIVYSVNQDKIISNRYR